MKALSKSAPYFAAYPLKVITQHNNDEPNLEPYLEALLASQAKPTSKAAIFPMVNPYTEEETMQGPFQHSKHIVEREREPEGQEWFRNYE